MRIKLLTKENLDDLPPLGSQDGLGDQAIAHVRLFTPDSCLAWYLSEYNPETGEAFGLVVGREEELGYFSIPGLMTVRGKLDLPIERDRFWSPRPLRECRKFHVSNQPCML